jgi:hypothetical protein
VNQFHKNFQHIEKPDCHTNRESADSNKMTGGNAMNVRAWMLAAVLALGLTACGNNQTQGTTTTTSPSTTETTKPAESTDSTFDADENGQVEDNTETTTPNTSGGQGVIDAVEDAGEGVAEGAKDVIDGAEDAVDDVGNGAKGMLEGENTTGGTTARSRR